MSNLFNQQNEYSAIRRPVVTEKTMSATTLGRYTFEISPSATKPQIKRILEDLYKVKVASVSRFNRKGKRKVFRGMKGVRAGSSFAVVKLLSGSIDLGGAIG